MKYKQPFKFIPCSLSLFFPYKLITDCTHVYLVRLSDTTIIGLLSFYEFLMYFGCNQ